MTPLLAAYAVLLGPLWETAVGQVGPIAVGLFLNRPKVGVAASVVLFELMHLEAGPADVGKVQEAEDVEAVVDADHDDIAKDQKP